MLPKLFLFVALLHFTYSVHAEETHSPGDKRFYYCYKSLEQAYEKFSQSKNNFKTQLSFVCAGYNILVDFLNTANEDKFYEQLRALKPYITEIEEASNELFSTIYRDRDYVRDPFTIGGSQTYVYHNIKAPLKKEECISAYNKDLNRHNKFNLTPKHSLNIDTMQTLISGQSYNYIVNSQNEVFFSYAQRHRLKVSHEGKILISPGHSILAGCDPVLSAGLLTYYKVGRKKLYIISCSSGHFHPLPSCLIHLKNYLLTQNVPEESIILLSVPYEKILYQLHKMNYEP